MDDASDEKSVEEKVDVLKKQHQMISAATPFDQIEGVFLFLGFSHGIKIKAIKMGLKYGHSQLAKDGTPPSW